MPGSTGLPGRHLGLRRGAALVPCSGGALFPVLKGVELWTRLVSGFYGVLEEYSKISQRI